MQQRAIGTDTSADTISMMRNTILLLTCSTTASAMRVAVFGGSGFAARLAAVDRHLGELLEVAYLNM